MITDKQIQKALREAPASGQKVIELRDDGERGSGRLVMMVKPRKARVTAELKPLSGLMITVGSGEQDSHLGARRTNNDPPFRVSGVRQRWGVLDQLEAESVNEERNRRVIVIDDDRCQLHE